jgi:DNA-binding transcriptional LysR family regulator
MRDPDITTLRLFVAVCDAGNIARAAEQQHIVASAVSKRLAALEQTLGTPLLERRRGGVAPTAAGQALLEHARTILFTVERIRNDSAAFAGGVRGQVRILASASAIAEALLEDVAAFMRSPVNRAVKVDIEERVSREVVRGVRDGVAPLGICWDTVQSHGLQRRPYRRDRLALAVPRQHALARRRDLRFEETLAYEHVALPPNTAVHAMLQQAAAAAGRPFVCRAIVSNFDAALRVVAAELAVSVIPLEVGARRARMRGVRVIPLVDAWAQRRFAIVFRAFDALAPPAQRMVEHLARRAAP